MLNLNHSLDLCLFVKKKNQKNLHVEFKLLLGSFACLLKKK